MLYSEVVYSIRERIRQNIDDSDITNREIIFHVNNQRALFYRNQYNQRNRAVDEEIKQILRFELEPDKTEVCGTQDDCYVVVTKQKLPPTIEFHDKNGIFKITSLDKVAIPFNFVSWNEFPYVGFNKFTKNQVYATVGPNNHIYLKSSSKLISLLTDILVTVILENPLDVANYELCPDGDKSCTDLDTFEYPLKAHVYAYISNEVVNTFINKLQIPEDKENDSES